MFYVGLDIRTKRISACMLSETGQVDRRAQFRSIDEMMRVLEALPEHFEVCYEASCGDGHYQGRAQPNRLAGHGGESWLHGIEWERPHTFSWRSAIADDAE
jgi:hypothetical protein